MEKLGAKLKIFSSLKDQKEDIHKYVRIKGHIYEYWIIDVLCFIDKGQSLWLSGSQQTVKILKEMGIPDHLTCILRNLHADQEATVRTGHGTMDWFQIGKGVHQGCILSLAYLTHMQSTSRETLGWMKHKVGSRLPGEIWITSDMQMTPPLWKKVKKN